MSPRSLRRPTRRDAGFAVAWLLAVVLLVPVQLASMILFDATGLDVHAPDLVFVAGVPALVLAPLPGLAARRLYGRRSGRTAVVVAVAAVAVASAYLSRFYGVCGGPGC